MGKLHNRMTDELIEVISKHTVYTPGELLRVWHACDKSFDIVLSATKKAQANNIALSETALKLKTDIGAVISRFNSDTFIDNVCLSYRHDFGLMEEQDRQRLRFKCKEWMRAISNNWEYFKNGL